MEIRIFALKYLRETLIGIYHEGRVFSYFPQTKMIHERNNDSLENLIETYKEITQECIENFQYNEILKTLQEYLNGN